MKFLLYFLLLGHMVKNWSPVPRQAYIVHEIPTIFLCVGHIQKICRARSTFLQYTGHRKEFFSYMPYTLLSNSKFYVFQSLPGHWLIFFFYMPQTHSLIIANSMFSEPGGALAVFFFCMPQTYSLIIANSVSSEPGGALASIFCSCPTSPLTIWQTYLSPAYLWLCPGYCPD